MNWERPGSKAPSHRLPHLPLFLSPHALGPPSLNFPSLSSIFHQHPLEIFYSMTRTTLRNPLSTTLKINKKPAIVSVYSFSPHVFITKCTERGLHSVPTLPYHLLICSFISQILEQLPFLPGPGPGTGDPAVSKHQHGPCPYGVHQLLKSDFPPITLQKLPH